MRLLHLSDLHLSRYGETKIWSHREHDQIQWEPLQGWRRWQIEGCRNAKGQRRKMRLVDPEGVVHWIRRWPEAHDERVVSALLARAMQRHETSSEALVESRPAGADLEARLRVDELNTNLRLLQLVDFVVSLAPDLLAITGDLTENGFGYELVQHYLGPWIAERRLLVVPGNHDVYDMFPRQGRKARAQTKGKGYDAFARAVGMGPSRSGAWLRRIEDVAFVGFNSCVPPGGVFSAAGEVSQQQIVWLRRLCNVRAFADARLRVGLVHHHVMRMPFEFGKRPPIEVGMRLRNAAEVMKVCTEAGLDIILNGHRHQGYMIKLHRFPTVLSAPSSTLGCHSSGTRYAWMVDLDAPHRIPEALELPGLELARGPGSDPVSSTPA